MIPYVKFMEGKKVVFVGPATTLMDTGSGPSLDADFDVIVRTNGSIFLLDDENFVKDYGTRCDVLYTNVQFHREMGPFPVKQWVADHNLQYLHMKNGSLSLLNMYGKFVCTRTLKELIAEMHSTVPGLLMGPIIIEDVLRQNPASLHVTGMDFYMTKPLEFIPGDYREYYPNYLPEKIMTKADVANIGRVDPHDQYYNTKFIYDKWKEKKITVDNVMVEYMAEIMKNPQYYTNEGKKRYGNTK